jgi:glutamate-ammonia-ligase adenylyltransferase
VSPLGPLLARSPDPEGAGPALERFVEQGGAVPADDDGQALLVGLLSNGSYLVDLLLADPGQLPRLAADPHLRRPKPAARLLAEIAAATDGAADFAELCRRLRIAARAEMLRLGAREIGWGTTLEVARELAGLADACLDAAVRVCDGFLRQGHGAPTSSEGPPSFVVLGMGKLGGEELNFSSDVDLIYVYSTDEGSAGGLTLHEYYARLSQMVTRAISEATGDGAVFRVDLRLRPEGRSGAICNSALACERYYEAFGRTWERQALLRARPCAGDRALGERLLRTLEPFVHPRAVGPDALEQVKALRLLFRQSPGGASGGFDVKHGTGGIRDVELVAQLLQLLHAGKRRDLRERSTLPALHKLTLAGLLSDQEQRTLAASYRFWRRVEHRVQLEHGLQTHALPADPAGVARLARRLGYPDAEAFTTEVRARRTEVRAISDTLGAPEGGPSAAVLRLLDSVLSREEVESELRAAGFRQIEESANALELAQGRLPAAWLEEAIRSPDPDRALAHFRDLALRASLGVFTLLRDEPQLLRMLAGLFGTSDRLSRHLVSHPAMWEPLVDGLGAPEPRAQDWRAALPRRLAGLDFEEALREMRRYQAEEILRIGIHDVAGNLSGPAVSAQLAALAEACLGAAVELVAAGMQARFGLPDATLTILGMGSFGARDMRYGSDLDLVFLYSRAGETARGMDHQEWFGRLAQRVISALGALLDEGRLYEVDTRLRPSGEQGMLVTTYDSFDRYHQEDAAPWERVALLRARPVFTSAWPTTTPQPAFAPLLEEIAYERPVSEEALRAELLRMRALIEAERAVGKRQADDAPHLRFSPGGLTDLEFLAAFGQLRHGARGEGVRALRLTSPYEAIVALSGAGLLPGGAAPLEDYRFLQQASLRLRLLRDRPDDRLLPDDRAALARSLGTTEEGLMDEVRTRMGRVRGLFRDVLG